ncbi:MAG TPA: Hpt domain-containing protein, partial [Aquabacterium sp.]|nr:Hpt domain-containing protein [Aquabacterium sp.]
MANPNDPGMNDDLSTLAWVYDELRRSLENAHKALHRYLKEAEALGASDVDTVDPAILRQARAQVHQSVGALELVGLGVAAQPLRAAEAALQRLTAKPKLTTPEAVRAIEQGSFAVLDFLARRLAGKTVSPLLMFPQYRALQELAGANRIHPADLWGREWQWHELAADPSAVPRAIDPDTLTRVETELLPLMRGPAPGAAQRMSDLFAGIAAGATDGRAATLWQLAAAYFEAQARGLLPTDVYGKRVASRLLAQLRAGPHADPSDRLAQDLLFFAAQARLDDAHVAGPRLAAARRAFGLEQDTAADYEIARLGRFDPAWIAQARKRVAAAKECWSAVAGGELMRLQGLAEPFTLVGESLNRLYPDGDALAGALQGAVSQTLATAVEPPAELAMEVATALLYVDASLEDADFDHPEMAQRVRRLAKRIEDVRAGREPGPLDRWMEELYRRVSDRQTMGSVVQELRASLSEVEKQIDQYFRNPAQRELLFPVPAQLSAMRGVLSVLGMDQASQAVLRMRDDVDELANTEVDPTRAAEIGSFDRLADNLGALSFLIDMVSVQPQLAKSLFRFDPVTGNLSAAIARADRNSGFADLDSAADDAPVLVEQAQSLAQVAAQPDADPEQLTRELERLSQQARAADQPALAEVASRAHSSLAQAGDDASIESARRQLAESISDFVALTAEPTLAIPEPTRPVPPPSPPAAPGDTGLEDDAEMREIFLEEAREVIDNARAALAGLQEQPADAHAMTTVRRAFHTLKGSSRMVGLREFGEAGWACEQLYNARLADAGVADAALRGFTAEVLDHFQHWVEAIEQRADAAFQHGPVSRSADALRLEHRWLPLAASLAGASAGAAAAVAAPDIAIAQPEVTEEVVPAAENDRLELDAVAEPDVAVAAELPPEFAGAQIEVAEVIDFPPLAEPAAEQAVQAELRDEPPAVLAGLAAEPQPEVADLLSFNLSSEPAADLPPALPIEPVPADAPAASFDAEATVTLPTLDEEPPPALESMVPGLPLAADLDLDLPLSLDGAPPADGPAATATATTIGEQALPAAAELAFELRLPDELPLDGLPGAAGELADEPAAADAPHGLIDLPEAIEAAPELEAAAEATLRLPPDESQASGMPALDPDAPLVADFELHLPAGEPAATAAAAQAAEAGEAGDLSELVVDLSDASLAESAEPFEPVSSGALPERVADDVEVIDVDAEAGADMLATIAAEAEAEALPPASAAVDQVPADTTASEEALAEEATPTGPGVFGDDTEQVKVIGPLRISIPLFNIYLNEADELSRRLATHLAEWALEPQRPVGDAAVALAHSLAGSSATVGYAELSQLARSLEHALMRSNDRGHGRGAEPPVFAESGEEIRRLLHQFAAGFLRSPDADLLRRLQDIEHAPPDALLDELPSEAAEPEAIEPVEPAEPVPPAVDAIDAERPEDPGATTLMGELGLPALMPLAPLPEVVARPSAVRSDALDSDEDIDAVDAIDEELFPIFEEEGQELIPQLQARLRDWGKRPGEPAAASACMRTLHTLKGGARLAGAMRLGEMAHRLETAIEHLLAQPHAQAADIEPLAARADAMEAHFEALCRGGGVVPAAHVVHEPSHQDAQDSGLEPVLALDSTMEPTLDL